MTLTPGTRLGPYEILSRLGAGRGAGTQMGIVLEDVYSAKHVTSGHLVFGRGGAAALACFEREGQQVATLNRLLTGGSSYARVRTRSTR
jgi:hypothetical protein